MYKGERKSRAHHHIQREREREREKQEGHVCGRKYDGNAEH